VILRQLFKNSSFLGRSPRPSSKMFAVVEKNGKYIPRAQWLQERKAEQEQLEIQKRMAASLNEPYDTSFRSPVSSTKVLGYDFSQ